MIDYVFKHFDDLSKEALYEVLQLRNEVFIVEQNCPYLDIDDKDQAATHLLALDNNKLVGYARLLFDKEKNAISFGRLITAKSHRGQSIGKCLMEHIMSYFQTHHAKTQVKISAQCYLKAFYAQFGFKEQGNPYDEDGLPHIQMIYNGQ